MDDRSLLDHYAVRVLGERFADAANRHDYDRFATLWTADAVWDLGDPIKARFEGLDAIREGARTLLRRWDFFAQMPHAFDAEFRGDRARAYWTVHSIYSDHDGFGGRTSIALYLDDAVRTAEGWKFARRRLRTVYTDARPLTGKVFRLSPDELQRLAYDDEA